jgi:hypothetical protein
MTVMQLIIPSPIEEPDTPHQPHGDIMVRREPSSQDQGTDQGANNNNNNKNNVRSDNQGAISDELRQNFEAMKAVWRQADRESGGDAAILEDLRHKERAQAIETAIAVETEIAKWQMGIAELEAMLAAGNEEDEGDIYYLHEEERVSSDEELDGRFQKLLPVAAIRFPSLPPVVVPDDDENTLED